MTLKFITIISSVLLISACKEITQNAITSESLKSDNTKVKNKKVPDILKCDTALASSLAEAGEAPSFMPPHSGRYSVRNNKIYLTDEVSGIVLSELYAIPNGQTYFGILTGDLPSEDIFIFSVLDGDVGTQLFAMDRNFNSKTFLTNNWQAFGYPKLGLFFLGQAKKVYFNNKFYFKGGMRLWETDGTPLGTHEVVNSRTEIPSGKYGTNWDFRRFTEDEVLIIDGAGGSTHSFFSFDGTTYTPHEYGNNPHLMMQEDISMPAGRGNNLFFIGIINPWDFYTAAVYRLNLSSDAFVQMQDCTF